MVAIPGFPSNAYDWNGMEVASAIAGLIVRDAVGAPRPGVLPSRPDLVRGRSDWYYDVSPFVAVRADERRALIGPSPDLVSVPTSPAPSSNARLDVIYSRPADVGAGEAVEEVFVVQGLASAVPVKPALPAGAVELATARVSAGNASTAAALITNSFQTTVCAGGVVPFRTVSEMNSWLGVPGQIADVGGFLYRREGASWQPVSARIDAGIIPKVDMAGEGIRTVEISFTPGRFTEPPVVDVTPNNNTRRIIATCDAVTKNGATVVLRNLNTITAHGTGASWHAIQV